MDVNGIVILVPKQLRAGIFLSSNGRERMVMNGIDAHVPLQLKVGISHSSTGRERMDVPSLGNAAKPAASKSASRPVSRFVSFTFTIKASARSSS